MITIISGLFIFMGTFMMMYHIFIPVSIADFQSGMIPAYNISGFIFMIIGVVILFARTRQTGASTLLNLPREDEIKVFYTPGHSTNTRILNGKLLTDNLIRTKNDLLINYKGGGYRIAGHECVRVHGNVAANIPEWLEWTISAYREKYSIDNIQTLWDLYERLRNLDPKQDKMKQLAGIPQLNDALNHQESYQLILATPVEDLMQMAEYIWDGQVVRLDPEIDDFIQTATPAYIDQYAKKEYVSRKNRDQFTKSNKGGVDWSKWALPIGILLFLMLMGAGIVLSMM